MLANYPLHCSILFISISFESAITKVLLMTPKELNSRVTNDIGFVPRSELLMVVNAFTDKTSEELDNSFVTRAIDLDI